jgi:hypothetical protein
MVQNDEHLACSLELGNIRIKDIKLV